LYNQACHLLETKGGMEEARWTAAEDATRTRERVRKLVASQSDKRIKVWARARLAGERGVDLARAYGYRDGSGVRQVIKRLEATAQTDRALRKRLEKLRELSRVKR
jgi:hypothetical protein